MEPVEVEGDELFQESLLLELDHGHVNAGRDAGVAGTTGFLDA